MENGKEFVEPHFFEQKKELKNQGDYWLCEHCGLSDDHGNHIPVRYDTFGGAPRAGYHHFTPSSVQPKTVLGEFRCAGCGESEANGMHISSEEAFPDARATRNVAPDEVHEYEAEALINWPDQRAVREFCGVCGKPEKDRLHFHEFKLVFGGYTCQHCGLPISADVHKGVDVEGITERPVRELDEVMPASEFWVDEDKKERKKLFGRVKVDPQDDGDRGVLRYSDGVIDQMVRAADEDEYKAAMENRRRYNADVKPKKKGLILPNWAVVSVLGSSVAANVVLYIYVIINN